MISPYTSRKWAGGSDVLQMKFVIFGAEVLGLAMWLFYSRTLSLSVRTIGVIVIIVVSQLAHWALKAR
ncbi:hypothetical protein [Lactiplantibacillus paraplantarum]|uniref:hypothetical protein n=1 Tax=Lactiplantibacillus paraplantarum TaxID=60520 RepID=UPI0023AB1A9F|nr:hypothetical protein [Lactiplantibacillus paraplantarum]WEE34690.1 hypothetical protein PWO93_08100 [Lactiplantibacillus paraplantarum]